MDVETKLNLVKKQPTIEILTEDELKSLLQTNEHPTMYVGYEPSGPVHIGTWLGAMKQVDYMNAGFKVKVLLADYHAWLNRKGTLEQIEKWAEYYKQTFIAAGLKNAEFVLGSTFQLHRDYISDVWRMSLEVSIPRIRRSMDIIGRDMEHAKTSQFIYPLMQIADIKYLNVDVAHGDMPQRKIHALARELLPSVGYKKPIAVHHDLLLGLNGGKMSSSIPESHVKVNDSPEIIKEKINKAFCPPKSAKDNVVLQWTKLAIFPRLKNVFVIDSKKGKLEFSHYDKMEKAYVKGEIHPADLKESVAKFFIDIFKPIREHFERNPKYLEGLM